MEIAAFHSRRNHLGLEIRRPLVERAETRRQRRQLDNLHKPRFWIRRPRRVAVSLLDLMVFGKPAGACCCVFPDRGVGEGEDPQ